MNHGRRIAAHIAEGNAAAGGPAPAGGAELAHGLAAQRQRLAAPGIGGRVVEDDGDELLAQRLAARLEQGLAADETRFVQTARTSSRRR